MIDDFNKLIAIRERPITNRGDRIGDGYARQVGATRERRRTNRGDRIGDGNARQAVAITERI